MARNVDWQSHLNELADFLEKENQAELKIVKPKLNIEDFDLVHSPEESTVFIKEKNGKVIGKFPYMTSKINVPELHNYANKQKVLLPENITMDYPNLDPEYRKRGLGEQVYKKVEELTGKKILPDSILSDYSSSLHEKKGLGKSFGQKEYGPDIIRQVSQQLNKLGINDLELNEKLSKGAFNRLKELIVDMGVPSFKSVAPVLGKVGAAAAGGALSLAAEAADSPDAGGGTEQASFLRQIDEQKRRDYALKNSSDKERQVLSKMYENIDNPSEQEKSIGRMKLLDSMLKKR